MLRVPALLYVNACLKQMRSGVSHFYCNAVLCAAFEQLSQNAGLRQIGWQLGQSLWWRLLCSATLQALVCVLQPMQSTYVTDRATNFVGKHHAGKYKNLVGSWERCCSVASSSRLLLLLHALRFRVSTFMHAFLFPSACGWCYVRHGTESGDTGAVQQMSYNS